MVFKSSYREEVIMAMTPEAKVKAQVVKLLRRYDAYYFFPAANGYGRAGIPDIISCVNGKFIAIECKAGSNTTTALQKKELDEIQEAKGIAAVINETNIDLVEQILKELTQ
jgi:Holliday junction resolvase